MKRVLLFGISILLLSAQCFAQSPKEDFIINRWQSEYRKIHEKTSAENPDYKSIQKDLQKLIDEYDTVTADFKDDIVIIQTYNYYDLACYRALDGDKEGALDALLKSIEYGYDYFIHMRQDSDLDTLRDDERFVDMIGKLESKYIVLLREYPEFEYGPVEKTLEPFTYQNSGDADLTRLREYFELDKVAGDGDEISQIKNLLLWVHNTVRHDGGSYNPESSNAIDMFELCRSENRGVNCRMLAQILNECYLAMGFPSRYVTCMPMKYIGDCHVINMVYSRTLGKWLWMDPSFNAYVTDEEGNLLSIEEVRQYLISDKTLILNEDANWNNEEPQTVDYYFKYYMAKNLFYMSARQHNEFNSETFIEGKEMSPMVSLYPVGYLPADDFRTHIETNNTEYFWQTPAL